ncbi:class I SAM-dependent DNA methyltransferase [Poseidonibacter lekithochrous]|uniref:class I SAM-dependent DNA methyltransferase n=1 Tax=Poseidonibacter lekithochrous TaxID=1904463 RepID=UPI0008FCD74D|nr:methyltransferase domain-containing protein [Poseidonibacter lekithochrous]QKJ21809.1 methyltransferase [Poseidonibacter lekithochrous]
MGLDLYSKVEPFLDFEDEVYLLHKQFMEFVMVNELDNIIDIGCGQGYFLENLKINGKTAFGTDLSVEQIKVCKAKGLDAKAIPLNEVKEKYDCATAIFDVLNYMDKNYLETFIKETNLVLNQGGYFVFDVNSHFGFDNIAQGCITIDLKDKFIAIDALFEDNKLQTDITLFNKQKSNLYSRESDSIIQEYHSKEYLSKLLENNGFKIQEIREFNLHSEDDADKYIFICKKIN